MCSAAGKDCRLRRRPRFLVQHTVALLLFISALGFVRPASMPTYVEGEMFELAMDNSYIVHYGENYYVYYSGEIWDVLSHDDLEMPPYNELEIIEGVTP